VWIDQGHRGDVRATMRIHRFWGGVQNVPVDPDVVVASIQQLHSVVTGDDARRDDLAALARQIGAVVVDEAHRMLAPSYTEVLRFLGLDVVRGRTSPIPLLGLTATPFRANDNETRSLASRFNGVLLQAVSLGENPVQKLRGRGVLSNPVHEVL